MERFDWKATIKVNIFSLWIIGLWPKDDDIYKLSFYSLYATISVIFFMDCLGILQLINLFLVYSDFEELTEMTLICMSESLTLIKVYIFVKNMDLLKKLMATLDSDIFQPKSLNQRMLIASALNNWKIIYNVFSIAGRPARCLWIILPVLDGSKDFQLPMVVWYPYDIKSSPVYEITYLHQVISICFILIAAYNIDMFISALMMYVGAQCDILCDNLRNLNETNSGNFNKTVIDLIKHHKKILSFAKNSNNFFNFILLAQFFASTLLIALVIFRLVLMSSTNTRFYTFSFVVVFIMVQIFTYCWFGNEVEVK
ncbi:7tm 6 domain containing protein, partial [Asbolus verrucosus]